MPAHNKITIAQDNREKEYSREEIINFAREAKTQSQLANILGVHRNTIANMMESDEIFCACVKQGFTESNKPVIEALYKRITKDGDIGAIKYWLGNREREEWVEKQQIDTNVTTSSMSQILDELEANKKKQIEANE